MLLHHTVHQRRVIAACCPRAAALGVRPGMDLTHARALLPTTAAAAALIAEHRPEADARALHRLALACLRLCPAVALDPTDAQVLPNHLGSAGLLMDFSGCHRLYRRRHTVLRRVDARLRSLGLQPRLGAGPTVGIAWALARFGPSRLCVLPPLPPGTCPGKALADLPLLALRPDPAAHQRLDTLGVRTIGDALALPRTALPARYGPQLALRIDQFLGQAIEPLACIRQPEPLLVERVFDGPVTDLHALTLAARELLGDLITRLDASAQGARSLQLTLTRPHAQPITHQAQLSRASRSPRHLWSLLRDRLERSHLGFGVERLTLQALRVGPVHLRQRELTTADTSTDLPSPDAADAAELVDTLVARIGPHAVLRPAPVATHVPERATRPVPAIARADRTLWASPASPTPAEPSATLLAERPTCLLPTPEPAQVMAVVPDGPPVMVHWRNTHLAVLRADGPERLAAPWWSTPLPPPSPPPPPAQPAASATGPAADLPQAPPPPPDRHPDLHDALTHRDYFRLSVAPQHDAQHDAQHDTQHNAPDTPPIGACLWVFRHSASGRWFVHGLWA
jgi:protein ImuB